MWTNEAESKIEWAIVTEWYWDRLSKIVSVIFVLQWFRKSQFSSVSLYTALSVQIMTPQARIILVNVLYAHNSDKHFWILNRSHLMYCLTPFDTTFVYKITQYYPIYLHRPPPWHSDQCRHWVFGNSLLQCHGGQVCASRSFCNRNQKEIAFASV